MLSPNFPGYHYFMFAGFWVTVIVVAVITIVMTVTAAQSVATYVFGPRDHVFPGNALMKSAQLAAWSYFLTYVPQFAIRAGFITRAELDYQVALIMKSKLVAKLYEFAPAFDYLS